MLLLFRSILDLGAKQFTHKQIQAVGVNHDLNPHLNSLRVGLTQSNQLPQLWLRCHNGAIFLFLGCMNSYHNNSSCNKMCAALISGNMPYDPLVSCKCKIIAPQLERKCCPSYIIFSYTYQRIFRFTLNIFSNEFYNICNLFRSIHCPFLFHHDWSISGCFQ